MGIFYVNQKNLNVNSRHYWGGSQWSTQASLRIATVRLAYRGCKNLTHTSKIRQVQRTQMVATAMFTIRVLVTFSDC